MQENTPASSPRPAASAVMARGPGETKEVDPAWEERARRLRVLIDDNLPNELRKLSEDLMDSLLHNAGVAERFDAFCVQAFSKPEWAVPASAFIGELFEDNEDRLAELARVPDLVIELGCGQAAVSCTVASKWATRGETHRLSRLAESIIAAQGTMKNPAAVEVMLALAATLAITRPSRAEQLFNAAAPQAADEHAESLADAKRWIAAGKSLASAPQEIRDLWDMRLRRPRMAWKWESPEERKALKALAEYFDPVSELAPFVQKIVPTCWWDLVQQKAVAEQAIRAEFEGLPPPAPRPTAAQPNQEPAPRRPNKEWLDDEVPPGVRPHASSTARFILGWACGVFLMLVTFFMAPDAMYHFIKDARQAINPTATATDSTVPPASRRAGSDSPPSQASPNATSLPSATAQLDTTANVPVLSGKAWRDAQTQKFARHNTSLAHLFAQVKRGNWNQNQMVLSGHNAELPFADERYLQLLVWLHLDPPEDAETRHHLPKLLFERAGSSVLAIWEGLSYPGSPNQEDIRLAAREAYDQVRNTWSSEDAERMRELAQEPAK
ncbi:MAG: hypothetical protein RIS79_2459 [Verrucomicrobiota bacterium]